MGIIAQNNKAGIQANAIIENSNSLSSSIFGIYQLFLCVNKQRCKLRFG
jgi:hypothetical protein